MLFHAIYHYILKTRNKQIGMNKNASTWIIHNLKFQFGMNKCKFLDHSFNLNFQIRMNKNASTWIIHLILTFKLAWTKMQELGSYSNV